MKNFIDEWREALKKSGMQHVIWQFTSGDHWASYKQVAEDEYLAQIRTQENFDEYKKEKNTVVNFFEQKGFKLNDEKDMDNTVYGYWKQLQFFSIEKVKKIEKEREAQAMLNLRIGSIYAPGSLVNFGTISSSPISIDNSVCEIEKKIEELGGEDKASLYQFLNETKAMLDDCSAQKQITPKPGFLDKLNNHVVKHGWFYGAILQLIGTAALGIIG